MGELPFERMARERQRIVRKEAKTSEKYGCPAEERPIAKLLERGIIVLDKPAGPTSHQVSDYLKRILKLKKAGHSGTLDPAVTGVLPVGLGHGTRIVQSLLTSGKEYVCVMHLHAATPEEKVREVMAGFIGKIKQLPPIKSAVKRQWRYRKIYYLEILEIREQEVLFVVGCQAGTYIRKLCHDIGQRLGFGAHMAELRRTKVGPYGEQEAVTLHDVADAYHYYTKEGNEEPLRKILRPLETGVAHLPKVWVMDSAVNPLCHGMQLKVPGISAVESDIQVDEPVAVMTLKDELILVGTARLISREMASAARGIAVKTEQVFMEPDTYPRME